MWLALKEQKAKDPDLPQRAFDLTCYGEVLDGTLYDCLPYSFHTEKNSADEYVKLRERRPSVRYALCKAVVDDSVGLLFSEEHFPSPKSEKAQDLVASLRAIIKDSCLNETMIDAATRGSVGSICIQLRVLKGRSFFTVLPTAFLTPKWDPEAPDTLLSVTEKYKTTGKALSELGYQIDEDDFATDYWFQRVWDAQQEGWFMPWKCKRPGGEPVAPTLDKERTVRHTLGFVPLVWIRNLPGGDTTDGACTFKAAIDTNIEIDYLLSQGGRGLKYASDPTLMIKEPASGSGGTITKGGGNAIVVGPDGDAKMLEINGTANAALLEHCRMLRQVALESIHGNKADADKIAAAQSGRAMELMNQALIWLADKLRISYGEKALLTLLQMLVKASNKTDMVLKDGTKVGRLDASQPLALAWPEWYAPTWSDKTNEASALTSLTSGGILSKLTATESIADQYDIEDIDAEIAQIQAEAQAAADAAVALSVATNPPVPDNSGD